MEDEYVYGSAFRKVLAFLGKKVDKKYPQVGGIGVEENWPGLLSKYHIKTSETTDELARLTQEYYIKHLSRVKLRKGFTKLISSLRDSGMKTALATSNTWWLVDNVFAVFRIAKYFDVVTTKEEVTFNKPSPDIYLLTAKKLGIKPLNCLVVEDSVAGLTAARDAGMRTVAIVWDGKNVLTLKKYSDLSLKDFTELSPDGIKMV